MTTKPAVKLTAIIGAIILILGAVFHMSALPQVRGAVSGVEPVFFKKALTAMWVMPSAHWIFIAFLSLGLSRYRSNACAAILIAFGAWMFMDALISFVTVGLFIGVYIMAAAGLCLLASGLMLRAQMRAT